jgi:hypothetical protein
VFTAFFHILSQIVSLSFAERILLLLTIEEALNKYQILQGIHFSFVTLFFPPSPAVFARSRPLLPQSP